MLLTKHWIAILFLGLGLVTNGQKLVLTGYVYDAETKAPLPFANISSKSHTIGTASNSNGAFKLIIPAELKSDSLVVSFIGYTSHTIPIPATSQSVEIDLQKEQTELTEVVLKGFTAETIVKKALDRIADNYFKEAYISTGFYRVSSQKDQEYIHLSEAVFDVYHSKTAKPYRQLRLDKKRSVKDEEASKGIDLGLSPSGVYGFDIVNNVDDMDFLNKKGLKTHTFVIDGHMMVDGKEAYKVSFDQKSSNIAGYKGYMLIDKSNYAFLYFDFGLSPKGVKNYKYGDAGLRALMKIIGIQISMSKNQYQIEYKKIDGRYYLNKVGNDASLHFKSDRNHYNFKADTRVDYIVNYHQFDSVSQFSNEESLKKGTLIEEQASHLNPDFWKEYTIIVPTQNFSAIAKTLAANNQANDLRIQAEEYISKLPKDSHLRIDSLLQFFNKLGQFNGTALIYQEGATLLNKSYNSSITNNAVNSQFRIGSLSKTFTAMLIMQLENEGKLHFSDPVSKFLPDYAHGKITIDQLLSHQSGIPDYLDKKEYAAKILSGSYQLDELVLHFCSDSLEFNPGSRFDYSNSNFTVLALIAERIDGNDFGKMLNTRIFDPLEMTATYFGSAKDSSNVTTAFLYGDPEPNYHPENVAGAGGITSTVTDLLKWSLALDTEILLPNNKKEILFKPRIKYTDWDAYYGYGWMIDDFKFSSSKKHTIVYHPGTDLGFYCMFLKQADTDITIILWNNTGEFPRFEITDIILDELN
ncbi:serine hydrolase [Lutimonas sp.]|uniref:serine hydrolase n=1 Tax=Lutimonas sp. TaxID=1872403 RepID=UPI003D9AE92F